MGRPARFDRARILGAAREVVARRGPQGFTLAGLSEVLGAPIGSIYHRYSSREMLLADLWLETVESFQPAFLARLDGDQPVAAGLAAVRFAFIWVAENRLAARLLLLHRREDFVAGVWPEPLRERAQTLEQEAAARLGTYCRRLYGECTDQGLRRIRLAISDLPQAAFREWIESGRPLPGDLETLVLDTCRYILSGDG